MPGDIIEISPPTKKEGEFEREYLFYETCLLLMMSLASLGSFAQVFYEVVVLSRDSYVNLAAIAFLPVFWLYVTVQFFTKK